MVPSSRPPIGPINRRMETDGTVGPWPKGIVADTGARDRRSMQTIRTEKQAGVGVALLAVVVAGMAAGAEGRHPAVEWADRQAHLIARQAAALYRRTPPD